MRKNKASKCLVIDTDIARAADGGNTLREPSKSCRIFMATLLEDTEHKVVLTRAIQDEWNKHQSFATLTWRRTMIAQKRVCFIDAPADTQLRQQIEQCASRENKGKAMLKDIHLIEAAHQADKIVISMDETVRSCFRQVTHQIRLLTFIAWVNPCIIEEKAIEWLHNGAEMKRERLLGYRREESTQ